MKVDDQLKISNLENYNENKKVLIFIGSRAITVASKVL